MTHEVHIIWLGSPLNKTREKYIPGWNKLDDVNLTVWYDSRLLSKDGNVVHMAYLQGNGLTWKDVSQCDVFKGTHDVEEIYLNEVGLSIRKGLPDSSRFLKNFGMASDILRMVVLRSYPGFYVDLDIIPYDLRKLDLSHSKVLVNTSGSQISNNAIYMPSNREGLKIVDEYLRRVVEEYVKISSEIGFKWYLTIYFVDFTLETTGPWMLEIVLEDILGYEYGWDLAELIEDPRYGSSWISRGSFNYIHATYLRDLVSKKFDMVQFLNGRGYSIGMDNVLMKHIIRELTGESIYIGEYFPLLTSIFISAKDLPQPSLYQSLVINTRDLVEGKISMEIFKAFIFSIQ
jgi:hypothetical protein